MPIAVACQCGKRFRADDRLAGRQVKCPACGGPILVPAPAGPSAAATPSQPSSASSSSLGGLPPLGGSDLFSLGDLSQFEGGGLPALPASGESGLGPAASGSPSASRFGQPSPGPAAKPAWAQPAAAAAPGMNKVLLFGMIGGGIALALVILVVGLSSLGGDEGATATGPSPAPFGPPAGGSPAASPGAAPPGTSAPGGMAPAGPPAGPGGAAAPGGSVAAPGGAAAPGSPAVTAPGSGQTDATAAAPAATGAALANVTPSSGGPPRRSLDTATLGWFSKSTTGLSGTRPVEQGDSVLQHFSWMVELLPYLGHESLYAKFRFDQTWMRDPNLQLTATVIPEFLNPADDRRRWKGYPFHNVALTHYVGMSGIEDRRNVVAAELPRSDPRAGVFGYGAVARPEEITDGLSQTLMVLGSGELTGPWVQGGGATIRGAREPYFDEITGFGSKGMAPKGVLTVFADGSVRSISADIDPQVFRAMCTIHGAETIDLSVAPLSPGGIPVSAPEAEQPSSGQSQGFSGQPGSQQPRQFRRFPQ